MGFNSGFKGLNIKNGDHVLIGLMFHAKTPINNFPDFCLFVPIHPIGMLASFCL